VLALRARGRLQRDGIHASDRGEYALEFVQQPQTRPGRSTRPGRDGSARRSAGGEFLRELWIEFHRARAERIETRVDSEVHLREPGEVPYHVVVGQIRDRQALPPQFRRHEVREIERDIRAERFSMSSGSSQ